MKKLALVFVALVICSSSFAGDDDFFSFGPRVGLSSSKVKISDYQDHKFTDPNNKMGFHVGLFARLQLAGLYVQPELLYTSSGGTVTYTNEPDQIQNQLREYKFNKIDIPVMVGFKFLKVLRVNAGPSLSFLLNAKEVVDGNTNKIKDQFNTATIGYQAGIGADLGPIILDIKYEGSLSKYADEFTIAGNTFKTDIRNPQIIGSVGIKF